MSRAVVGENAPDRADAMRRQPPEVLQFTRSAGLPARSQGKEDAGWKPALRVRRNIV